MKEYELRMYFFVPYNISEIQKGIQAGHASLEYARIFGNTRTFKDFVDNYKTWIILNGGTTNNHTDRLGSLQEIHQEIINWNLTHVNNLIDVVAFYEPDLNDAMSAFCFICDQRVWDYENYSDFKDFFMSEVSVAGRDKSRDKYLTYYELKEKFPECLKKWVENIMGGEKNVFLRELLKGKRLA